MLQDLTVSSLAHCVTKCLTIDQCVSFNWEDMAKRCQLNNAAKDEFPADVVTASSWNYYDIDASYGQVNKHSTAKEQLKVRNKSPWVSCFKVLLYKVCNYLHFIHILIYTLYISLSHIFTDLSKEWEYTEIAQPRTWGIFIRDTAFFIKSVWIPQLTCRIEKASILLYKLCILFDYFLFI